MPDNTVRVLVTAPLGVGGVTNLMINIQSHMDRSKVNFDYLVYHDRKEPLEQRTIEMGSTKFIASTDSISIRPLRRLLRINEIRRVCKKNNIQILHYNADNGADVTNLLGAKLGGVKYITIHSHNAGLGKARLSVKVISTILKPLIPMLCDYYMACSDLAAKFLFPKSVIKKSEYIIVPNGIELEKFDYNPTVRCNIREKLGLNGKYVIGHAGRFTDQKNHSFLLDIFKIIHEIDSNSYLILFGVGELFEAMKKKAQLLGIEESVLFYGTTNEMDKMWQAMDVFVMPSLHEGLPVTGVEAQASGLPCVFSDAITREIDLTGNSEFISLSESPKVWAEHVLNHKSDIRMSGVPALMKSNYDIQQVAEMFSNFYINIADRLEENLTR